MADVATPEFVVYTTSGCIFCKRAKALLKKLSIPFEEIDLSHDDGTRREELSSRTNQFSLPQIFINDLFVGGCCELNKLNELGLLDMHHFNMDALAPRARSVSRPTFQRETGKHLSAEAVQSLLEAATLYDQVEALRASISRGLWGLVSSELSAKQLEASGCTPEQLALYVSKGYMLKRGENYIFCSELETDIINGGRRFWQLDTGKAICEPEGDLGELDLATLLRDTLLLLYDEFMEDDGRVDFKSMVKGDMYRVFKQLSFRLQCYDPFHLDYSDRKAFFINIYNSLAINAFAERGHPTNDLERLKFFPNVSFLIGKHRFTLDEIEHCILRGNPGHRHVISTLKWAEDDPRYPLVCRLDWRIHFALNCGASSCPMIKVFSGDKLDQELELSSKGFLSANVRLEPEDNVLWVSMLLKWYGRDFPTHEDNQLVTSIMSYLNSEQQHVLSAMLEKTQPIEIKFLPYNWSPMIKE